MVFWGQITRGGFAMQIHEIIRTRRTALGLTQEQLASAVGVRRETIMRLEKAQYNPSLKLAVDISRTVEAPIEEIFIFE